MSQRQPHGPMVLRATHGTESGASHAASATPTATASNASAHVRHMVAEFISVSILFTPVRAYIRHRWVIDAPFRSPRVQALANAVMTAWFREWAIDPDADRRAARSQRMRRHRALKEARGEPIRWQMA